MSTSPDNAVATLLSEWLAFGTSTEELRAHLEEIDRSGLEGEAAEAVDDLIEALEAAYPDGRGYLLERVVRETLDAVALS